MASSLDNSPDQISQTEQSPNFRKILQSIRKRRINNTQSNNSSILSSSSNTRSETNFNPEEIAKSIPKCIPMLNNSFSNDSFENILKIHKQRRASQSFSSTQIISNSEMKLKLLCTNSLERAADNQTSSGAHISALHLKKPLTVNNIENMKWMDNFYCSSRMDPMDWSKCRIIENNTIHEKEYEKDQLNNSSSCTENISKVLSNNDSLITKFNRNIQQQKKEERVTDKVSKTPVKSNTIKKLSKFLSLQNNKNSKNIFKAENVLQSNDIPVFTGISHVNQGNISTCLMGGRKSNKYEIHKNDIQFDISKDSRYEYNGYSESNNSKVQSKIYYGENIGIDSKYVISNDLSKCLHCSADFQKNESDRNKINKKSFGIQCKPEFRSIGTQCIVSDNSPEILTESTPINVSFKKNVEERDIELSDQDSTDSFLLREVSTRYFKRCTLEDDLKTYVVLTNPDDEILNQTTSLDKITLQQTLEAKHSELDKFNESLDQKTQDLNSQDLYTINNIQIRDIQNDHQVSEEAFDAHELDYDFIDPDAEFDVVNMEDHEYFPVIRDTLLKLQAAQCLYDKNLKIVQKSGNLQEEDELIITEEQDEQVSSKRKETPISELGKEISFTEGEQKISLDKCSNSYLNQPTDSLITFATATENLNISSRYGNKESSYCRNLLSGGVSNESFDWKKDNNIFEGINIHKFDIYKPIFEQNNEASQEADKVALLSKKSCDKLKKVLAFENNITTSDENASDSSISSYVSSSRFQKLSSLLKKEFSSSKFE